MLCGLLVDKITLSDWILEFPSYSNRAAMKVVSAPVWMTLLSLYTLTTFLGLLLAGLVSKLCPSIFTPLFEALLDKVAPSDTYSARPYYSSPYGDDMMMVGGGGGSGGGDVGYKKTILPTTTTKMERAQ